MICFMGLTTIFLENSQQIQLKNIKIGMILEDGSVVVCVQKFSNSFPLYLYNSKIYVSGDHKVLENKKLILVSESLLSIKTTCCPPYVYSITTDTSHISIGGTIFIDFSQSKNVLINKTINSLILNHWNNGINGYAEETNYLEQGFDGDTKIKLNNGNTRLMKDIIIGDFLENNNIVIGKVYLNPKFFKFYEFGGVNVSSNTKVYDISYWKNIECVEHAEELETKPKCVVNVATTSGMLIIKNSYFLDYLESRNNKVNIEITKLGDIGYYADKNFNIQN